MDECESASHARAYSNEFSTLIQQFFRVLTAPTFLGRSRAFDPMGLRPLSARPPSSVSASRAALRCYRRAPSTLASQGIEPQGIKCFHLLKSSNAHARARQIDRTNRTT